MAPRSPVVTLEEIPGTKYPDLSAAQRAALAETASDLATMIRTLLEAGVLVNEGGKIKPRSEG